MGFRLNIKAKFIMLTNVLVVASLIVLGVVSFQNSQKGLDDLGATNLQNSVELYLDLIAVMNEQVEKGAITLEEAQEKVKEAMLGKKISDQEREGHSIDVGENGYPYILNEDGVLLAHPFLEGENIWDYEDSSGQKFIQEQIKIAQSGGGFNYYDYPLPGETKPERKIAFVKQDPHWGWIVGISTYMLDFNKKADEILYAVIIVMAITIVITFVITWLLTSRIVRPIKAVIERIMQLKEGDLGGEPLKIKARDETLELADALNEMQGGLKKMIQELMDVTEFLASQSNQLTQSANEVMEATNQVASTMQELATASESQANSASEISARMNNFTKQVSEANALGKASEETTHTVLEMTERGSELMVSSLKQMQTIDQTMTEAVKMVEGLDEHTSRISELVAIIQDIAEQTNLLALNAAIEAARAGEHGQGFAVVAEEVRKLAEQSAESVTNITKIVEDVQKESNRVVDSLKEGYKEVERGSAQINETEKTFHEIQQSVEQMAKNIQQISERLEAVFSDNESINEAIQNIAAVSEEAAAGVEQVTASSEETSSSMEEVAKSSGELAKLADDIQRLVERFKV